MERLINIDNGGTLTDICVGSGSEFSFTKTLTTPADLSQCLFDGMTKVSESIFGKPNLAALLHSTQHIRYSSTQGTNALVERKGPRLGLVTDDAAIVEELCGTEEEASLFAALVGPRSAVVPPQLTGDALTSALVAEINRLTTAGAERLVLAAADSRREKEFKHIILESFPRHLLGSVPVLFSWEFAADDLRSRRIWSGIINSFLHPTVERFLYSAERRLRGYKIKNPLLIYRNDGASSRVAKSVALKTYSSGPRGGLEGTRALAEAYGLEHVLMIDIGGTTTDVGSVENYSIATERRGRIGGVPVSYELSDVRSTGVGGSSVISVKDGRLVVGPESVGAAPGPACFGFGGGSATITDVNLLLGVLDPSTYLDGQMYLDAERSRAVITRTVAEPLGISLEEALIEMDTAYARKVADSFSSGVSADKSTTLAAFGGGGPMSACAAARIAGVRQVLVPRLAAVFSAFGISFSDISQSYEANIGGLSEADTAAVRDELTTRATRDMFQEGYDLSECGLEWEYVVENSEGTRVQRSAGDSGSIPLIAEDEFLTLVLQARRALPHARVEGGTPVDKSEALAGGTRAVRTSADRIESIPVFRLDDQQPGAVASGPAIVEGQFFTARVPAGWNLEVSNAGDLILADTA
ncbi:hydantoinase/oxoprolinase family protein [Rhodococcus sp. IEGM 1409]|uniref:hydantoinase/oxoprolinase family protein n=1 Tax=Rhodococcus sp. IEGM 1409 TaxID=3047082 RepID=UPI0024B6E7C7|nr:hydantoinase/oxoprolinase family protein [Rhodococcus sp. IEGM 1409]MDI9902688.1 hydantoinase/oxoprolinase family protein [Rhodococcus sp. IEGM 1409]